MKKIFIQALILAIVIAGAFYLANLAENSSTIRDIISTYGYFGVFFLALVSGFNLFVPIPAIAFMPLYMVSGLHFLSTILIITLGMVVADSIAYVLGRFGHSVFKKLTDKENKILSKIGDWRARHRFLPLILIFLFAALIPLPNELLLVPIGILGYRFLPILPVLASGNLVFNLIYSSGILHIFESV